nr:glycosyltransferase [Mahella australiensis]
MGWVHPATNGVSTFITRMQDKYADMGHRADIVSLKPGDLREGERYYAHNSVKFWEYLSNLDSEPDVVHANDVFSAKLARERFPDVPIVLTVHNILAQETLLDGSLVKGSTIWHNIRRAEIAGIEAADWVVFVSNGQMRTFLEEYAVELPDDMISSVVYNGLDKTIYPTKHKDRNSIPVIVSVGRLAGVNYPPLKR